MILSQISSVVYTVDVGVKMKCIQFIILLVELNLAIVRCDEANNGQERSELKHGIVGESDWFQTPDKSDWVDPNDIFNYDPNTKRNHKAEVIKAESKESKECLCNSVDIVKPNQDCEQLVNKLASCTNDFEKLRSSSRENLCKQRVSAVFKRLVEKFLTKMTNYSTDLKLLEITFSSSITSTEMKAIQNSLNDQSKECSAMDIVDEKISHIIDRISINHNDSQTSFHQFVELSQLKTYVFTSFIGLYVGYMFFKASTRQKYYICFFVFIIMCVAWEWQRMYMEKLAEKAASHTKPEECTEEHGVKYLFRGLKTWLSSFYSWDAEGNDKCAKYYKSLMVDPMLEVNPLVAASELFAKLVGHPLVLFSDFTGRAVTKLFHPIPFMWKLPILIALVIIITYTLYAFFRYGLKHVFQSKPKIILQSIESRQSRSMITGHKVILRSQSVDNQITKRIQSTNILQLKRLDKKK